MEFNLNENIHVKLTERGYQHLADLHNKFIGKIPNRDFRTAEYYKNKADPEGYSVFQAWRFIEYFGGVTRLLSSQYFSMQIKINKCLT